MITTNKTPDLTSGVFLFITAEKSAPHRDSIGIDQLAFDVDYDGADIVAGKRFAAAAVNPLFVAFDKLIPPRLWQLGQHAGRGHKGSRTIKFSADLKVRSDLATTAALQAA